MAATRTVKGKVTSADVAQLAGNRVQFQIDELSASDDGVKFKSSIDTTTDASGNISVQLSAGQKYIVKFPSGEEAPFFLEPGDDPADLDELMAAFKADIGDFLRIKNYIRQILPLQVKPILDEAAENVAQGAAGKSIVPFPNGPNAALGNNGDTGVDLANGNLYVKSAGVWGQAVGNLLGPKGDKGDRGDPGNPGNPGTPGQSAYPHVAYAESQDGGGFSYTSTPNSAYFSFVFNSSPDQPQQGEFTVWTRFKGDPGNDAEGQPGQSSYTFIRYAEDAQGTGFSETPNSATAFIGLLSTNDPEVPDPSAFSWVPFIQAPPGASEPLPTLYVKLSQVSTPTFQLSMESGRAHVIERDAAKAIERIDLTDAGRADVTFVAPRTGTIHPVTLIPAEPSLVFTSKKGYADNYLFKSFNGKVLSKVAYLDIPYDPVLTYWIDGGGVVYLFEAAKDPLKNRIADSDHIGTNTGTVRNPYGLEETGGQLAFSDEYSSINFNQPFMAHFVFHNFAAQADGSRVFGFSSRSNSSLYLASNYDAANKRLYLTVRDDTFNLSPGPSGTRLQLPSDLSGMLSLLVSRDSAGRFNARCLNNAESLRVNGGTPNPDGYYPGDVATNIANFAAMGITLGGIKRTPTGSVLNTGTCSPRYVRVIQEGYSAARAKASHNFASDWIAGIDPQGPQLARLP